MSVLEIVSRLILIGGSTFANLDGHVNVWVSGILGLASLLATAELAVRPYGTKIFDRLLLMAGGLVVTFIILGLLLNLTPFGLTLGTWNAAWGVLSTGVLIWRRGSRSQVTLPGRPVSVFGVSVVVAAVIIIGAGALAVDGVKKWDAKTLLSFSLVSSSSTSIVTQINATSVNDAYSIKAFSKNDKASHYTSKPFTVSAGSNGQIFQEQVPVNAKGSWVIDLVSGNTGKVVRELIVDVD
jgi:hypothetical protein